MTQPVADMPLASFALANGYQPKAGFDEMVDADGIVRAHWQPVLAGLGTLTPRQRTDLSRRIDTRVREIGLSHDQFADPGRLKLPWQLNLMPLVFAEPEWREIAAGVVQRARIAQALADDIYGPQTLMRRGVLPAGVVYNDPSYLRPCHGMATGRGRLQFFAVDIARDAFGRWRVVDTHTETPAGIAYALANRTVLRHFCGELLNASQTQRHATYFKVMQDALGSRVDRSDPTVALLTPGPTHDDFLGHAYLARYLGMLLVEGADLKVDDGRVHLKTLEGLEPLDLVVRCAAGSACDPLELDPSGFLGPVGLMQALRRNPGLVVNAPGTAIIENRGIGPYRAAISSALIGEDLMMPDAEKIWLGDPNGRRRVLGNLDGYFVRDAFEQTARPGRAAPARDASHMTAERRAALVAEIGVDGERLVAEVKQPFGTAPAFGDDRLEAQPFVMRVFATATPEGFTVMPGGLAMTVDPTVSTALTAFDGRVRDVWVRSERPLPPFRSLWRPVLEEAQVQRLPRETPSRAADNLFWLGRAVEHADWVFRLSRSCLSRVSLDAGPNVADHDITSMPYQVLCRFLARGDTNSGKPPPDATDPDAIEQLVREVLTSTLHEHALPQTLADIARLTNQTRDRLSLEAWQTLSTFDTTPHWQLGRLPQQPGELLDLLDQGLRLIAAFNGLSHENMTRNPGWSFLDMGRRISRAINSTEMLAAAFGSHGPDDEGNDLMFVLEMSDSFITYRSRYRLNPNLALVLDLLVLDDNNPRSLAFQLTALSQHISSLPQSEPGRAPGEIERRSLALLNSLKLANVSVLAGIDANGARPNLLALLDAHAKQLPLIVDAITRRYFNVAEPAPRWSRAINR